MTTDHDGVTLTQPQPVRYLNLSMEEIRERLEADLPNVLAHIAALDKAARKPTWKEMNDFVVDL